MQKGLEPAALYAACVCVYRHDMESELRIQYFDADLNIKNINRIDWLEVLVTRRTV